MRRKITFHLTDALCTIAINWGDRRVVLSPEQGMELVKILSESGLLKLAHRRIDVLLSHQNPPERPLQVTSKNAVVSSKTLKKPSENSHAGLAVAS